MKKLMVILNYLSFLLFVIFSIIVALYYLVINKSHEGPMDLWAILLMTIPFGLNIIFSVLVILTKCDDDVFTNNKFISKLCSILNEINRWIIIILSIPFIFILSIIEIFFNTVKKSFKPLIKKGYSYKKKNKFYYLIKDNIIIKISYSLEEYLISFDYGKTFVKIEESELGIPYEREQLKSSLNNYINAPSLYKQKGDAFPPLYDYIKFLDYYLK